MSHDSYPCPSCGYVLQPLFRFCPSCGTPNQPPAPTVTPEAEQTAPAVDAETDESASVATPLVMTGAEAGQEQDEVWQMPQVIEQVEPQEESQASASETTYVDFASLFGYGNQEEGPAQSVEQVEQPASVAEVQAAEEGQAVIDEPPGAEEQPVVEEDTAVAQDQVPLAEASATADETAGAEEEPAQTLASEGSSAITGPLPVVPDLPAQAVELDEDADAAPEIAEVEDREAGVSVDIESEHAPAAPYTEVPDGESGGGAASGPLGAEPAYEAASTESAEEEPANAKPPEQIVQAESVYAIQTYEVAQPEPVEEQPAYEPAETEPDASSAQPEVISFSELFAWQSADETSDSTTMYTPPAEATQEEQQEIEVSPAATSEQAVDERAAYTEPEPPAGESSATIYTFDYSTPQGEDDEGESDTPSWKPGDEPVAPAQPANPVYQSYSQSAPPTPATPPPVQPAMPPPGERPRPGTPEYEEMARRAMEGRGGTPATAPVDTSPLSTPSYTNPTPPQGYTPEPAPQAAPPPPAQPAMPPSGQRPKPGTPEYEEMARRAMEQRGGSSTNTSPLSTAPQPQTTQPIYSPEPPPQPAPPAQPAMPSPGQRPKPGTPEYEEMARRAMEERRRQQGQ